MLNAKQQILTDDEHAEFMMLEDQVERGKEVYYRVGKALLRIRDARLYRADYPNWESYCVDRWKWGRSYANKLIAATEMVTYLGTDCTLPENEAQARPLTTLEPEYLADVWTVVKETAPEGVVTSGHIQSVVTVCKEVILTGAIDNGDGESVSIHDLFKHAVAQETTERTARMNQHIADNAAQTAHKGQGLLIYVSDRSITLELDKSVLNEISPLLGKRIRITITEATS